MNTMQKMIDVLKPNDKRRNDFRFKRLYRSKWYELTNTEEDSEFVRIAVNEIYEMQRKLLKNIGKL